MRERHGTRTGRAANAATRPVKFKRQINAFLCTEEDKQKRARRPKPTPAADPECINLAANGKRRQNLLCCES